jgi:NAD-dependent deacetylase
VLWFDECYDEENYRFNSSIDATTNADMLLVVGTSGATNLPMQVGSIAAQKGAVIIDINPDFNPFSAIATKNGGFFLQGPAGQILPDLVNLFKV